MRRLIVEEPVSRAAIWGRRFAWFSLPVLISGIVLVRGGSGDLSPGFAVIGAAFLLACVGLIFAVSALVQIWRYGRKGLGYAISGMLVAGLVIVFPGALGLRLLVMPYYADLTTDAAHPPAFSRSTVAFAARGGMLPQPASENILAGVTSGNIWKHLLKVQKILQTLPLPETDKATLRQRQRQLHPNLVSLNTEMEADAAFARARVAAEKEGWTIIEATPPSGRFGIGHLDAVKLTRVLKLPIDVTVRLRPHAEGTTIDVRTIPRYRLFDVGSGPRNIEQYFEYFTSENTVGK